MLYSPLSLPQITDDGPSNGTMSNYTEIKDGDKVFVMTCHKWAEYVKAARHMGAVTLLVVVKAYSRHLPPLQKRHRLVFARKAAAYIKDHPGLVNGQQAYVSALQDCGAVI